MSVYDDAAVELADIFDQIRAGTLAPFDAAPLISAQLQTVMPDSQLQFAKVEQVLGRITGLFFVDGPPDATLGKPGASAIDLTNHLFYGPKDAVTGWPAGVAFVGATGPAGTITGATAIALSAGAAPTVTLGGTATARTFQFGIPAPDISNLAVTWNGAGDQVGLGLDITDTLSGAGSLAMRLRKGGATLASITKAGAGWLAAGLTLGGALAVTGAIAATTDISVGASQQFRFTGQARIGGISDGVIQLLDAAGTSFNRLQFGGSTSSFPALKRIGSTLQVYLADDSNYAQLTAGPLVGSYLGLGYSGDAYFLRDAAGAIAQYNGANAQTFRIYNTRTDGSNYERAVLGWSTNLLVFGYESAGTGAFRSVRLSGGNSGSSYIQINPTASARQIQTVLSGTIIDYYNSSGHRLWETDGVNDIGALGANRPKDLHLAGNARVGGFSSTTGVIYTGGSGAQAALYGVSDGVLRLTNSALSGFSRLQFGGTTSSFCALKPNGPNLELRLADDSGVGNVFTSGGFLAATGNVRLTSDTGLISLGTSNDTVLQRDAADIFAQYRGTNPQTLRIYNTRTDGSNYERGSLGWSTVAGRFVVGVDIAGTGAQRGIRLAASSGSYIDVNPSGTAIQFVVGGTALANFGSTGSLLWNTDNTYDIGASGANRPRNLFIGGILSIGDGVTAPGATAGAAKIYVDAADGDLKVIFGDGTIKTIVTDT